MMVRLDRQQPDVYFGRPGALIKMPWPRGDLLAPYDKLVYDFVTGAGQHQVSMLASGSREYTINWNALHVDTYAKIEQYWTGAMGVGPWVFIDPSRTNLLLPNQASATSLYNDTRHWANTGGVLQSSSNTGYLHRFGTRRSLRWWFSTAAPTTAYLDMTWAYRSWYGIPVVPGLSYAWSSWIKADMVIDTSINVTLHLRWMDAAGAQISITDGGVTSVGDWVQKSAVGVAPPGAAYVQPRFVVTGSTVTTGGSLFIDEPMLEQDSVINSWASGTGLRPVEIINFPDQVPFASRFRIQLPLTLRELAA